MLGLPDATVAKIQACLQQYPQLEWVKVYGSRAKGNYRAGSDIDLAYSSATNITGSLWDALDQLPTPYQFDVTHLQTLSHPELRAHIERVGVLIYTKTTQAGQ
jgi:uncharacterized protein